MRCVGDQAFVLGMKDQPNTKQHITPQFPLPTEQVVGWALITQLIHTKGPQDRCIGNARSITDSGQYVLKSGSSARWGSTQGQCICSSGRKGQGTRDAMCCSEKGGPGVCE